MNLKSLAMTSKCGVVAFLLFALLFADAIGAISPSFIGSFLKEITDVCRDASTQWRLVLCLACYFILLLLLERRFRRSPRPEAREKKWLFHRNMFSPDLWLTASVLLALLRFALEYDTASHSIQILILMVGIVFGKAIATWARWRSDEIERRAVFLIRSLVCLLAASALWQPEKSMAYQYHGIPRWNGVWDNPNLYGLMMGVGVVLAAGQIAASNAWKGSESTSIRLWSIRDFLG